MASRAAKLLLIQQSASLQQRALILGTQAANLIFFTPLGETSGTAADDVSATNADGAYAGTYTLDQTGIGDGSRSTLFAGGRVSLAANLAALSAVFSGDKGTALIWGKVSAAGVWTDGTARVLLNIGADAGNRIFINKSATNNQIDVSHRGGGTARNVNIATSTTGFFVVGITWDRSGANEFKAYYNGTQSGSTQTALGTFTGSLAAGFSAIGDLTSSGSVNSFSGNLAHMALWKTPLTAGEMAALAPAAFLA